MSYEVKETEKIKIYSVSGGDSKDQDDLKNCYFQQFGNPGDYHFYNPSGEHIHTAPSVLTGGTRTFRFIHGGFLWTIRNFELNDTIPISTARGNWHNDHNAPVTPMEDGTFQAQAGGGAAASASSATA